MKKLFLTISLLLFGILAMAQTPFVGWVVATPTTQVGRIVQINQFIFVTSTGDLVQVLRANTASSATVTSIKALGSTYYKDYPGSVTGGVSFLPLTNGSGTIGTSALKWATGYINAVNAVTISASTSISTPSLTGTTIAGTTGNIGTVNAATLVAAASTYCSVSLGAIFMGTDGKCYRLSVPAGTYATVTCPSAP